MQADLCVGEHISMCRGRRHVPPANGSALVTICSGEWDTCHKQLLTADRRWGVCFVVAWSWARCRPTRMPTVCLVWREAVREPCSLLPTQAGCPPPLPASLDRGSSLLSLSWAGETVEFPVGKRKSRTVLGRALDLLW